MYVAFKLPIEETATTTSTEVLPINNQRAYLMIQNIGSNVVVVSFAEHVADEGIRIPSGGNWEPNEAPINEIWIKTLSATSDVIIIEGQ